MEAFRAAGIIEIVLFTLLLTFAIYNTVYFLFQQKRYRIYFISIFYVFAYIVIVIRLALALMLTFVAYHIERYRNDKELAERATVVFLSLEIVATYAKIGMGFFQVVAILILTLQVKEKFAESIDTISWWLYFGITIWTAMLIIGVVIFIATVLSCLNNDNRPDSECFGETKTGIILNGVCFALLSVLLIVAIIPLFSSLRKLQQGKMQLTKGVKMLTLVFGVFTFCYLTRTLYDLLIVPNKNFGNLFSGVCLPILWDVVPISLMFAYHFQNSRVQDHRDAKKRKMVNRSQEIAYGGLSSSENYRMTSDD